MIKETMGIEFGMNVYSRSVIRKMLAAAKKN